MNMKKIAIIPARAGSKRVPHKNIKPFLGKPMMTYPITAALDSGEFDEVMVSTDSEEFAEIARSYGAHVPFLRSAETANDYATTGDVMVEVLNKYHDLGQDFDILCCMYPAAVFVTPENLHEAIEKLIKEDADCVSPVVQYGYPPQRAYRVKPDGTYEYIHPEYERTRTQDLEPIYHDVGQYYIYNVKRFLNKELQTGKNLPVFMDEGMVQDIDTPADFEMAEMKYRKYILHQ